MAPQAAWSPAQIEADVVETGCRCRPYCRSASCSAGRPDRRRCGLGPLGTKRLFRRRRLAGLSSLHAVLMAVITNLAGYNPITQRIPEKISPLRYGCVPRDGR